MLLITVPLIARMRHHQTEMLQWLQARSLGKVVKRPIKARLVVTVESQTTPRLNAGQKAVEKKATLPFDQQAVRLHEANVLIQQKKFIEAQLLMTSVTEEKLGPQKQKLVAQLPADVKK